MDAGRSPLIMETGIGMSERKRFEAALNEATETLERRVAERTGALRESEERLRLLVDGTKNCALFMLDPDGQITTWNEGARRLKGYESNEVVGRHFSIFYTPEDVLAGKPARELETAECEGTYEEEGDRVCKNGSRFHASVLITALRDEQGCLRGYSKVTRDITERVRADEALRASEERLRLLLQAGSMGTFEVDVVTGEGRWNATEFELLGLKPGDAPPGPETFFRFVHPEDVGRLRAQWERALLLGKLDAEFRIVRADGETRWLAGRGQFVFEGKSGDEAAARGRALRFLGVNFDITELKRAEELLAKSRDRFDGIISAAMDAIISINRQQRIVLFNPAAEKMFGVPAQEAVGENINRFIPARFREGHGAHVQNFDKTGVSTRHMGGLSAVSGLRANGEEFPIEASISQVEVNGERLFTVILRDITARQRAEEDLRASHEQLRALAGRIQAVREEERTHAAREIHDVLAQELTGLKIDLAWLNRRLTEPIIAGTQRVLQEKISAMMDLTDKASQSVRRIAAELRPVVLDSLGLCAATEWIASDFQTRTEIRCVAIVPSQDLAIDRDRSTALFRILQESLTNVARHAQATRIEVHLWREAGEVLLTVRDDGRGVQPNELKNPHSMGLLGMRERATLLGGQCFISAHSGGGTVVEVRLPIAPIVTPNKNV